jgi:hypothetical protein
MLETNHFGKPKYYYEGTKELYKIRIRACNYTALSFSMIKPQGFRRDYVFDDKYFQNKDDDKYFQNKINNKNNLWLKYFIIRNAYMNG